MPPEGVVFATCVFCGGCDISVGLSPTIHRTRTGMLLNAISLLVHWMHIPWRTRWGSFLSGVLFVLLTIRDVPQQIVDGIPDCLKHIDRCGDWAVQASSMRNAKWWWQIQRRL